MRHESSTLLGHQSSTGISVEDVGVRVNYCCKCNPWDRWNNGAIILNNILRQNPNNKLLRHANFVNKYSIGWAYLLTIIYLLQIGILFSSIYVFAFQYSSIFLIVMLVLASVCCLYDFIMYIIMLKHRSHWKLAPTMIPIPTSPSHDSSNAIIKVTIHNVNTLTFLHASQRSAIAAQLRSRQKAWLNFNFYSPLFDYWHFTCPMGTVCLCVCCFVGVIITAAYFLAVPRDL